MSRAIKEIFIRRDAVSGIGALIGAIIGGASGGAVFAVNGLSGIATAGAVLICAAGIAPSGALIGGDVRRRLRQRHVPARHRTVSAPSSLRWVQGMLPGDEGAAWLAEVNSCLAEAEPGQRRRYVRSYRWAAPQLIWTSWSEYLNVSGRRELL